MNRVKVRFENEEIIYVKDKGYYDISLWLHQKGFIRRVPSKPYTWIKVSRDVAKCLFLLSLEYDVLIKWGNKKWIKKKIKNYMII